MKRWGVGAAVVVVLFLAGPGLRWLADRSGAAASSGWTALHFADPEIAVDGLAAGDDASVSFVIENHEGSRHTYQWEARMISTDATVRLASGDVELDSESSVELSAAIPAAQAVAGARLEIALHSGQRIDLRVAPR